jgi:hypothetical protein
MQSETTVNADKFSEGYASVVHTGQDNSKLSKAQRYRHLCYSISLIYSMKLLESYYRMLRQENEALAKANLAHSSVPSTFVKRHRTGDVTVKQVFSPLLS